MSTRSDYVCNKVRALWPATAAQWTPEMWECLAEPIERSTASVEQLDAILQELRRNSRYAVPIMSEIVRGIRGLNETRRPGVPVKPPEGPSWDEIEKFRSDADRWWESLGEHERAAWIEDFSQANPGVASLVAGDKAEHSLFVRRAIYAWGRQGS